MEDNLRVDLWFDAYKSIIIPPISISEVISAVKTPGLIQVVRTFIYNAHRSFMLPVSASTIWFWGKATAETRANIKPTKLVPLPEAEMQNIASQVASQFSPGVPLETHLEPLISMQMVSTWTAFETLYGDLWKAALNVHPINLSSLKGTNRDGLRKINNSLVEKEKFDLRNSMGTILSDNFRFSSLTEIREAYKAAFCDQGTSIKSAVNDKSISAAYAIRNVIVHKAGVCDDDYKEAAETLAGLIPVLKIGERLKIDGELLFNVSLPALKASIQPIKSIDAWIEGHPAYTLSPDCYEWTI